MIFETDRLLVGKLKSSDSELFFELMSNPRVMHPIPQKVFSREESDAKLTDLISKEPLSPIKIWALLEKINQEFIGVCGFLKNDEKDDEIAYRRLEKHWRKGFGTEIAKGLIGFSFNFLNTDKITADVNVENEKSAKILEKYMQLVREFYNEKDQCTDRRYELNEKDYFG